MSEPTTAAERREMREEARAADRVAEEPMALRGGKRGPLWIENARGIEVLLAPQEFGACVRHSYAARPSRLLALLDEHEAQAVQIERLREALRDAAGTAGRMAASERQAIDDRARLRNEQELDRAAAKALVEALPRCAVCGRPATQLSPPDDFACDSHGACNWLDIGYRAQLLGIQVRMEAWGEAAAQPQSEPANPRWGAALAREAEVFARYKDPRAQRDAAILRAAAKLVRTEQEARLILEALGWSNPDAVERVLRWEGEEPAGSRPGPPTLPTAPYEGDDPHYRMVDVTSDPFGDDADAVPPEPDDEQSAYDAEVAERMWR